MGSDLVLSLLLTDADAMRRTREKIHRPQTRRRRENNEDSLDKMQQMRKNIRKAVDLMEHLVRREQKKLNIAVRAPFSNTCRVTGSSVQAHSIVAR